MPITLTIPEILLQIKADSKNANDIIRGLQINGGMGMRELMRYIFDGAPWYRNDLPPFTSDGSPEGLAPTTIYNEVRRFYIFKKDYNLPVKRKDEILTQILESVNAKEAELMKTVINGSFSETYGITRDIASKAFPDIIR